MATTYVPFVTGDSHIMEYAMGEVNQIISEINFNGDKKPGGKLYLGHEQRVALIHITQDDPAEVINDEFFGWPIIWVLKDSYIHLAV